MRCSLFLVSPLILVAATSCDSAPSATVSWPIVTKVAEHSLAAWYPKCALGGCWQDYETFEGTWGAHKLAYEKGDYGLKTGGKIHFRCKDDREVVFAIPTSIDVGWSSEWLENPCKGPIRKITLKAGLDGTWGSGTLAIYRRFP